MDTLIEKGTIIRISKILIEDFKLMPDFDIVVGKDILQSDDNYVNSNGTLFVSENDLNIAINMYMQNKYGITDAKNPLEYRWFETILGKPEV